MAVYLANRRRHAWQRPIGPFRLNTESPHAVGLLYWWPLTPWSTGQEFRQRRASTLNAGFPVRGVPNMGAVYNTNGTSTYIATGVTDQLTDFTCTAWFYPPATLTNFKRMVDKKFDTGFWMGTHDSATQAWGGGVLEGGAPFGRSVPLSGDAVHLLVSRRSGTTHTISADGGQVTTSGTVSGTALDTTELLIGARAGPSDFANFPIWDVRLYNRALSNGEIWALYDQQTRWDLYWQPSTRVFFDVGGAAQNKLLLRLQTEGLFVGSGGMAA